MADLAANFRRQGRFNEAEELEMQVVATRRRVLGVEHPDTLVSIGNLGVILTINRKENKSKVVRIQF